VAVQPDGRILLAAVASAPPHSDFGVVCFEPDGSLCAGFGNGGTVRIDLARAGIDTPALLMARIENIEVQTSTKARVVVDQRSGTIILGS
ncbi:MAG: flagellar basal body P-ring protein FlgI, partial [Flavobacteriales bacterium]